MQLEIEKKKQLCCISPETLQIVLPYQYGDLFLNSKIAKQNVGYPLCHHLQETDKVKFSLTQVS